MNSAISHNQQPTTLQRQQHSLSPQMAQGIRLLALSLPDLRQELFREMSLNPVIDDIEPTLEKTTVSSREREIADSERHSDYPEDDDYHDAAIMEGVSRGRNGSDPEAMERREKFFENQTRSETLEEHLMRQIPLSDIDAKDHALAELLIGELNDDGYFIGSLPDLVMVSGTSEAKIRDILAKIAELDPPGCGAITLGDCLRAQLDSIADKSLRERVGRLLPRLGDVAAGNVDDPEALRALRSLDPRPGRLYRRAERGEGFVNPEVHAVKCSDGWAARVDARSLPEIRISPKYVQLLEDPKATAETKAYIREKIAAAESLIAAVAHRQETVQSIAEAIFDAQSDFFEQGLRGLKPLSMREIAERVGVDVSTVSRTVRDKYAATPKGTIELRKFFVQGVGTASGGQFTRESVLKRLKEIIEAEDGALSDERLAELLKAEGFPVARRTVAKYRLALDIPGAIERRKK